MLWLNSKEYCSKYKIYNTTLKRQVDDRKYGFLSNIYNLYKVMKLTSNINKAYLYDNDYIYKPKKSICDYQKMINNKGDKMIKKLINFIII